MARERYLTLDTVAADYRLSTRTLRRRIAEGTLPAYRVGHQIRIRETDLHHLAERIPAAVSR